MAAQSTSDTRPSTAVNGVPTAAPAAPPTAPAATAAAAKARSTRAQNDAKLIFGTVFSLRNMVRKLGGDDDAFISYRTGQYRMHYYETPTNLRFVLLTDTATMSMRNVLHQIYINLWVEYGMFFCRWENIVGRNVCVGEKGTRGLWLTRITTRSGQEPPRTRRAQGRRRDHKRAI